MVGLKTFLKFVQEREAIRLRRAEGLPAPWTKDVILQQYRFCNIRRSDDRVSRWLIQNVLKEEYIQSSLAGFLMFSAWCRWINWPPTISKVIEAGFNPITVGNSKLWPKLGKFVDKLEGKKWTGAYMIVAPRGENKPGKGMFIARDVIRGALGPAVPSLQHHFEYPPLASSEGAWHILRRQNYFGSFMAGQVVGDWGYTSLLKDASDRLTWAPIGPGSRRGFNRLRRKPLKAKILPGEWGAGLQEIRAAVIARLGSEYNTLTALDVQNQLCEFDKYLRVKNGEGRPRAKYRPETAYEV